MEEILADHPYLEADDIRAALELAARQAERGAYERRADSRPARLRAEGHRERQVCAPRGGR
ncbi:MAG: hypothetical protein HY527_06580 [Betaproteobacteria bacterium]|nr:hypothetical protein [Betaproteobacteria bacterium]